jgi:hypothetical protein
MSARIQMPATPRARKPRKEVNTKQHCTALELEMQWNTLLGQQDLLREEIKRGEECLEQAQAKVAEAGAWLEEWPTYEKSCGRNCLPCLTESAWTGRRIQRFLTSWLKRRRLQLRSVEQAIYAFAQDHRLAESP